MTASLDKIALFTLHRRALVDYATPIVGCRAKAEDVVQESWLRFDSSTPPLQQPVHYLYRIVRNLALDSNRRLAAEHRDPGGEALLGEMSASTPSPEQQVLEQNALHIIAQALDELPERTRQAFELHRFNRMTFQQIAETMNISMGLAHKLVSAAVTHCANRLDENTDGRHQAAE
ncbi:sigma-70 family RNA polymerase sigma factor [Stutzerimonas kirkiae]|uniref:sigma-70 family RNA polymerase sigma factor n=1 Tax=Stutzerimonas kirkiae TaxID=2211392 RepID=UPI001038460B|nr:sigma-70 family RNA polymerase sigma factor [Stutzerimonas kirkiae]TBV13495.1 RNA polymerase subunit sigma-24 [Stutzerimonas kirkiae]